MRKSRTRVASSGWRVVARTSSALASERWKGDGGAGSLADDDRAGGEVAEASGAVVEEHRKDAHGIREGQVVDDADDIANHGVDRANRIAVFANDADAGDAFAGRLPVPDDLEDHVVAQRQREQGNHEERDDDEKARRRREAATPAGRATNQRHEKQDAEQGHVQHEGDHALHREVDQNGRAARANARRCHTAG